ncbi:diadenylate cyclase CdaA [Candidatus Kapabacteria bacterium]|nr:diadenylate cyclase CdaA [Candidatus Kapabacteria bacterium]
MEIISLGFLSITFLDIVDIGIVTFLFYWLYKALKDTIAVQILFGLVALLALSFATEATNLKSVNWILDTLSEVWLLSFVILFQPELRKLLLLITRSSLFQIFIKQQISQTFDEIIVATKEMSEKHVGALIVFPRSQNVQMTVDTGIPLKADVTSELLLSIFSTRSPLHDGAIVIENSTIEAARCILPLSNVKKLGTKNLGTRHRAGLGLTEQIDAVVLIISEETGWISIADSGDLLLNIDKNDIDTLLKEKLMTK